MPISNPASFFVTGSDTREFTYVPGAELWNFSPYDCGLSKTLEMNILIFADDEDDALSVVEDLLLFKIKCAKAFISHHKKHYGDDYDTGERERQIIRCRELLDASDQWVANPVDKNQVFKTGWASNDTI